MRVETLRAAALALIMLPLAFAARAANIDVALVTALEGGVARVAEQGPQPMQNFVKLKEGDVLSLDKQARLQIVYFDGGRQETWSGAGKLEIVGSESRATGLAAPQVRQLPVVMVRQIARTPALDSHGRAGVARLRSVPSPEAIARVEQTYAKWRKEVAADELAPEFYRLSSYFEMREIERVEQILAELQRERPLDTQAKLLISLYREAIFRTQKPAR